MRTHWLAAVVSLLAPLASGCLRPSYNPGALLAVANTPWAQSLTVGCLDVAVRPWADAHVPSAHRCSASRSETAVPRLFR